MSYTFIVEKSSGRIVFARDAAVPLYVNEIWPGVSHFSMPWLGPLTQEQREAPWNWSVANRALQPMAITDEDLAKIRLDNRRAIMIQILGRAVDRHRSVGQKPYLHQDEVYQLKILESDALLSGMFNNSTNEENRIRFPFLADGADHNDISLLEEARMVRFRVKQRRDALRFTEQKRRDFVHRILTATTDEEFTLLTTELVDYERRG